jgi:hypothetical protein
MLRRIVVGDLERVVLVRKGRFHRMLGPGTYWVSTLGARMQVERHSLANAEFHSKWADHLLAERPDVVRQWLTCFSTTEDQVAAVYLNGKLHRMLAPGKRMLFWRGVFAYRVELFDVRRNPEVPARLVPALAGLTGDTCATFTEIVEGTRGLLFIDGRLRRELPPGLYGFWKTVLVPRVEFVGKRRPKHPTLRMKRAWTTNDLPTPGELVEAGRP